MRRVLRAFSIVSLVLLRSGAAGQEKVHGKVEFARDILPILSANCFTCHGPDEKPRKAGLRLDLGETATKKLKSGSRAVVPGDPKASELIARVFAKDPDEVMPPLHSKKSLKE